MKNIFTHIYKNNIWNGKESKSGRGSDMDQTVILREKLPILFQMLKITSILDLPCGDFNWMRHVNLQGITYIGADIVPEIICKNVEQYTSPQISFRVLDLTQDDLPPADLLICRDCLPHFSFQDIFQTVNNLKRNPLPFILTTHFPETTENKEITTGFWRPINLCLPPFNFSQPLLSLVEFNTEYATHYRDKSLSLWMGETLPDFPAN